MKYEYKVKHDGIEYAPGEEVPIEEVTADTVPAEETHGEEVPKKKK